MTELTILDPVTNREVVGNLVKVFPKGLTIDDKKGIRYYVAFGNVRSEFDPSKHIDDEDRIITDDQGEASQNTDGNPKPIASKPVVASSTGHGNTDKKWMFKGNEVRRIPMAETATYLAQGFQFGKKPK